MASLKLTLFWVMINGIYYFFVILWYTYFILKKIVQAILIISYEFVNIHTGMQFYTKNLNFFCV